MKIRPLIYWKPATRWTIGPLMFLFVFIPLAVAGTLWQLAEDVWWALGKAWDSDAWTLLAHAWQAMLHGDPEKR